MAASLMLWVGPAALTGCSEDAPVSKQRGMPKGAKPINSGGGSRRSSGGGDGGDGGEEMEEPRPDRPRPVLTREDFSSSSRDPFHNYFAAAQVVEPVPVEVVRRQRDVKLPDYTFDDLRLIAIVNAGRNVSPTALFLSSSDNKSKSVKQGQYFSSSELLLASVNRDYIEIEVVDPELTPGWNLERGERKIIYLKDH